MYYLILIFTSVYIFYLKTNAATLIEQDDASSSIFWTDFQNTTTLTLDKHSLHSVNGIENLTLLVDLSLKYNQIK